MWLSELYAQRDLVRSGIEKLIILTTQN